MDVFLGITVYLTTVGIALAITRIADGVGHDGEADFDGFYVFMSLFWPLTLGPVLGYTVIYWAHGLIKGGAKK